MCSLMSSRASAAIIACEEWTKALKLLSQMQQSQVQPDAVIHNSAISASGHAQPWTEALRTFSQIHQSQVQHNVFT